MKSTICLHFQVIMASSKRTGSFQLLGDVLTRFSDHCTNTVTQTSSVAKSEIQVLWTAPPAGSGCVAFKAMVVENKWVLYLIFLKKWSENLMINLFSTIFNLEGFENQGSCHKTIGSVNTFLHVTIHKYCMGENEKFISNFSDIL